MPSWSHEGSCAGAVSLRSGAASSSLLLIYFAFFSGGSGKAPPTSTSTTTTQHATVTAEHFPKHSPLNPDWKGSGRAVTLGFGGDVHFAGAVGVNLAKDPSTALGTTIPQLFAGSQLTMVNLESVVTDGSVCPEPQSKPYIFDAPASAITALKSANISVVTEGNDHGLDCGPQGLSQNLTIAHQAGYPVIGIGNNAAQAFAPYRVTINGQRIAIIAATQVIADNLVSTWTASSTQPGVASAIDPTQLVREVQQVRQTADTVIVYVHWGTEAQACPNPQQEPLAQQLVKAGADVVIGADTHVLLGGRLPRQRVRRLRTRELRLLRQQSAGDEQRVPDRHGRGPPHHERRVPAGHDPVGTATTADRCTCGGGRPELECGPQLHQPVRHPGNKPRHHARRNGGLRCAAHHGDHHDDGPELRGDDYHHDDGRIGIVADGRRKRVGHDDDHDDDPSHDHDVSHPQRRLSATHADGRPSVSAPSRTLVRHPRAAPVPLGR